tara:strand:+ start:965 stop:1840 length:876 start_codon:yes stop_codon:yes gene_type:complete
MTFPFLEKGDAVTKLYKMNCSILRDSYNPAALSLNATMATAASAGVIELPFLADAAAYFCGDFNHNLTEGGMITFDRIFANIPQARTEQFGGSLSYTFPSVTGSLSNGTVTSINSITENPTTELLYVTGTVSQYYGQRIFVSIISNDGAGGDNVLTAGYTYGRGYSTPDSWVSVSKLGILSNFVSGSITLPLGGKIVGKTEVCTAFVDETFYLPSVTAGIPTLADVVDVPTFVVTNSLGNKTNNISYDTSDPTALDYQTLIDNKDYLIIKNEIKRYKGNIVQRTTTKVRAR